MFILKMQCTDFSFHKSRSWSSPAVTSFIWRCYSFSVHSVLFMILKIVLFPCLNEELSLWWIFSYLISLIRGLEYEQSLTIFYRWQIHTYIHTYIHTNIFQESKRSRFVVKVDCSLQISESSLLFHHLIFYSFRPD